MKHCMFYKLDFYFLQCTETQHINPSPQNTVRKGLADFAVFDWWRFCKSLCDVLYSKVASNRGKWSKISSHRAKQSVRFSNSVQHQIYCGLGHTCLPQEFVSVHLGHAFTLFCIFMIFLSHYKTIEDM